MDADALQQGRIDRLPESRKPLVQFWLGHETIGINSLVSITGQLALPVWCHQAKRVPALVLPDVHRLVLFKHQMADPHFLEIVADGKSGLATADDSNRDMIGRLVHDGLQCLFFK